MYLDLDSQRSQDKARFLDIYTYSGSLSILRLKSYLSQAQCAKKAIMDILMHEKLCVLRIERKTYIFPWGGGGGVPGGPLSLAVYMEDKVILVPE